MSAEAARAAILGSDDLKREPIDVPWDLDGEKLYVREMTAAEKDWYMAKTMPTGEFRWSDDLTASLVAKTVITEDGTRVFRDADVDALGEKSSATLADWFKTAMRLSGLTEDGLEEITEGFGNAQDGEGSSA